MTPAAIILAAGASTRMGRPKALLEFDGETFLDRLIGVFSPACRPVFVVVAEPHADLIRAGARAGAEFVLNPAPERGQLSSLQAALARLPEAAESFLFTPVDHPALRAATISALVDAFRRERPLVLVPRFGGRRGHPALCARALAARLLALPPAARASDLVHSGSTRYLDVNDPGVVLGVNTPEEYRRLLGEARP